MRLTGLVIFWIALAFSVTGQSVNFTSSNLPIVVVDTHGQTIVDEPKIIADMGIIDNGPGNRNNVTDPFNDYDGKIGIEIRGSSSQFLFPKKQYGIELRDDADNDLDASLLGMPEEEDWVLFAPYNDKALMRDVLAYKLGNDLGHWAPHTRYCELVLNGSYYGIYVLIEKIKRDKNRVDISKLNPDETSGDDLTGGYIVKLDKSDGSSGPGWSSSYPPPARLSGQSINFQYEYPDWDEIVFEQQEYIQDFIASFEDALKSADYADPVTGYRKYIDVDSWVDFFIIQEMTKNVDGYRLSTFFYKDKDSEDGKLYMGPIWDFNLGFGNANYCDGGPIEGFAVYFNYKCGTDFWQIPFWWNRLLGDPYFVGKLMTRWTALRAGIFKTSNINAYIDSVANVLDEEAQQRNFTRWPVLNTYVWPNYYVGESFGQEVEYLKQWVKGRLLWLDNNLPGLVTGIESDPHLHESPFSIYPNPFSKAFTVKGDFQVPGQITIEVFDLTGRQVVDQQEKANTGTLTLPVEAELSPGIYTYRILLNGKVVTRGKLVSQ